MQLPVKSTMRCSCKSTATTGSYCNKGTTVQLFNYWTLFVCQKVPWILWVVEWWAGYNDRQWIHQHVVKRMGCWKPNQFNSRQNGTPFRFKLKSERRSDSSWNFQVRVFVFFVNKMEVSVFPEVIEWDFNKCNDYIRGRMRNISRNNLQIGHVLRRMKKLTKWGERGSFFAYCSADLQLKSRRVNQLIHAANIREVLHVAGLPTILNENQARAFPVSLNDKEIW